MTFDFLIKGGTVLDGVANDGYLQDVGIVDEEIKAVGNLQAAKAKRVIAADGLYVAPGFIDVQSHSDSYFTLFDTPLQDSLITQGITTVVVGHCGTSLAPLSGPEAIKSVQKWHSLAGANVDWQSFEEYLVSLSRYPLGVNVASLVGHATLRRGLLGDEVRPATREEIAINGKLLTQSLEAGAGGMSLGLIYAHEVDASNEELLAASRIVAKHDKLLSVHLRSEGSHLTEALNEVLDLAEKAKVRVKLSHFKVQRKRNWPLWEEALAILDRAYQRGVDVFFDVYPYTTSWSVLYTYLPKWSYEGGRAAILQNIKTPATRGKILAHLRNQEEDFSGIFVATAENNRVFVGKTLAQIAANQEISVEEALLNVIAATNAQVIVFDHNLSEETLEQFLKHPLAVVASDGAGYDFRYSTLHGLVHPRCFGSMPKFLAMCRDRKLMSWAMAVKKITSRPAEKLGFKNRGRLTSGAYADIVVFDPREVGSRATYENPYQQADGIRYVFVNGTLAFAGRDEGKSAAGRIVRL